MHQCLCCKKQFDTHIELIKHLFGIRPIDEIPKDEKIE